jgi:SnoaL-like polyketide cyclase
MSVEATKQLIFALIDEVWNQHDPAAVARFFGPGLREEIAEQERQLLGGFPDLRVTVEGDLIADGELVVARLTPTGTHLGTFAGQAATGRVVSWAGGASPDPERSA